MFIDKTQYTTRPTDDRIPQELAIYDRLEELNIAYIRVDHDRADTIEICHEVEKVLEGEKLRFKLSAMTQTSDAEAVYELAFSERHKAVFKTLGELEGVQSLSLVDCHRV